MTAVLDKRPPTDLLIIDAHAHMGKFRNFHIPSSDVDGMIQVMDRLGIDVAIVAHHAGISSDFSFGNEQVARAAALYPGRILGYCVINPNYPAEVRAELEKCFSVPEFRGIKVHPELHDDYPLDGPHYRPMWEFAAARGLPVLSHSYFAGDSIETFERLVAEYPQVTVLLGHAGLDLGIRHSIRLAQERPNLVLDLTGIQTWNGIVELLVSEAPVEQIVFGSDMPFLSAALQLGGLLHATIDREQLKRVAGLNAARIFGLTTSTTDLAPTEEGVTAR